MMAKTKRGYILATCFLSGAAAIISFVALGTQEWVTSPAYVTGDSSPEASEKNYFKFGLFGGMFNQSTGITANIELTTICRFDLNICALLCGKHMEDNLGKLYNGETVLPVDRENCTRPSVATSYDYYKNAFLRDQTIPADRIYINAGIWLCTIFFLIISAVMGWFAAALAVWNTAASPYQVYFSIFGLYIYNAIAFFSVLLSVCLWGAMFAQNLSLNIPSYKTFIEGFTTEGRANLGYSYWINLVSLVFYMTSICLLYIRNYLISKEPEVNVHLEDNADPIIYLY